ncbi:MAG: orotidine-5'-phosphate decarboxylase [Acidimicrobiaceae bacterium]|nr:orotidine-5'-phosphate decarboxylase [Acidimicrobiaceae bacterium]
MEEIVARNRLALALDYDDLVVATRMSKDLIDYFGFVKVGLELYLATGPEAVGAFVELGFKVFLDLKLHDIPTTVKKAARVVGGLGASLLTMHAFGGTEMLRAGVEGLMEGAQAVGAPVPAALGVTVLTSDGGAPRHVLPARIEAAALGGCRGYVCATEDVAEGKRMRPDMYAVVAGIRPTGVEANEQRSATPTEAIRAGADLLVIGRAVTLADDPIAAAESILESVIEAA